MKRKRLTREQRREQTRDRLLDAGQAVFIRKGFMAASVEDIAETAGYTRGAFYSNFRSKAELFLELLRRDHTLRQVELLNSFGAGTSREDSEVRVLAYYSRLLRDNKCFLLWIEAKLLAARDARFRACLNALLREKIESLSSCIRDLSARDRIPMRLRVEPMATALIGLVDGMQLLHAVDPQGVTAVWMETVLAQFLARSVLGDGADFAWGDQSQ